MVKIARVIVHEIPKGRYSLEGEQVRLSSGESNLVPQTRRFIEENMLDFALSSPRNIVEDTGNLSITPSVVKTLMDSSEDTFVRDSSVLAQNLYQAQGGNSPSGILIVATLSGVGEEPAVAILKAEHQEGMRLQRDEVDGHFDLEHLNELIVGNNSRVYKIALLRIVEGLLVGQMVDQQNGVRFADFFMTAFLGCGLADDAEVKTKQFVDSAMSFVNKSGLGDEKRARYATALAAYMGSPSPTVQASEFSEQFLDVADRDNFIAAMPDDLGTSVTNKNLALVPGKGAALRLWASGVTISLSAEALKSGALEILSEQAGYTIIRIRGSLRRYGFGSAPKG